MSFSRHTWRLMTLLLLLIAVHTAAIRQSLPDIISATRGSVAEEQIVLYADQSWGEIEIRHGFLHGLQNDDTLSDSMTAFLKPRNWRLYKTESYAEAAGHNATITYGTSNHYAWSQGGFPEAKPWLDWDYYEEYVLYVLHYYDSLFPGHPPSYYDIWSEPDHSYYWKGTYEQLVELFARTANVIKAFDPDARLVGPSISWYRPEGEGEENIIELLIDLDTLYDTRLDAISWHENGGFPDYGPGRPEDIYWDCHSIKAAVEEHFPPEYQPEYHINEFAGGRVHMSPGWLLGYLFWINYMEVDFSAHACWGVLEGEPPDQEYYSDCWAGLNGVFMKDGYTPQLTYWVHRAYADLEGMDFVPIGTTDGNFLALGGRDDSTRTIHAIVGMYADTVEANFELTILDYPFANDLVVVEVKRLPNFEQFYADPPETMAWPQGPLDHISVVLQVDTAMSILIEDFEEGEVYLIALEPALCGDADGNLDGPDIADLVYLVTYMFQDGPAPPVIEACDVDGNGVIPYPDIADLVYLVTYMFQGGPEPQC